MGFLRYVEDQRKRRAVWLFDQLKADRYGKRSAAWSKWWGRYARQTLGITSRAEVFHSLRHAFKDAARESGLTEEHHDAITGHVNGGVGRSYGGTFYPLRPLAESLRRLRYSGLDLSTVKLPAG